MGIWGQGDAEPSSVAGHRRVWSHSRVRGGRLSVATLEVAQAVAGHVSAVRARPLDRVLPGESRRRTTPQPALRHRKGHVDGDPLLSLPHVRRVLGWKPRALAKSLPGSHARAQECAERPARVVCSSTPVSLPPAHAATLPEKLGSMPSLCMAWTRTDRLWQSTLHRISFTWAVKVLERTDWPNFRFTAEKVALDVAALAVGGEELFLLEQEHRAHLAPRGRAVFSGC
jgi:hypothetical protein